MLRQGIELHKFSEIEIDEYKPLCRAVALSYCIAGKKPLKQRCRHFSFVYDRMKLISFGSNSLKTHPKNLGFPYVGYNEEDISSIVGTHSELRAIIRSGLSDLDGMTMVNVRINRNEKIDYSFPCKGCFNMLKKFGFKDVYFSTKSGKFSRVFFSEINSFMS